MCNRYVSPAGGDMERYWHVGARTPWRGAEVFPRAPGPFIRAQRDATESQRELVIGQWGLVPWFAKTAKLGYSTNNARSEEIASKASFKQSWQTASAASSRPCRLTSRTGNPAGTSGGASGASMAH
jgi:putative SOS response-associated peptidase YedK